MRKSEAYPGRYFKAADFPDDWTQNVEIEMARLEEFQNGKSKTEKLVCYFRKEKQGLVCGPTIFDQIADVTGEEDSDDWKGHRVQLYRDTTPYAGKMVPCIRVRAPDAPPKKKTSKKPDEKPDLNDDISF